MKKVVVWTMGDGHGIGPEIILKAFKQLNSPSSNVQIIVIGDSNCMKAYARLLGFSSSVLIEGIPYQKDSSFEVASDFPNPNTLYVIEPQGTPSPSILPGTLSVEMGQVAFLSIKLAAELCLSKKANAMVTAPIHKQSLQLVDNSLFGHTELLGTLCNRHNPQMLFYDKVSKLRIALATIHIPLSHVPNALANGNFYQFVKSLNDHLVSYFGIRHPKLAVLGLNPHASDNGAIGFEENSFLGDDLKRLQPKINVEGFFAADSFFGSLTYKKYDAIIALYHDQGLIPFKLLSFKTGINLTLGLPIIRTSPDHGTAFDISGKGVADPSSFISAHETAIELI